MTELAAGTVLSGAYRVGLLVGRGGMGSVYDGVRLSDGMRVAIKALLPSASEAPASLQRFEREAWAASRLGHPNIVRVIDFKKAPNEPVYLVMEFIVGRSLRDEIEAFGPLGPTRAVGVALDVLGALDAAHRANIIHRDIKPDNIVMLDDPGIHAKVVDFGVVKVGGASPLTGAGQIVGTPAYMSPEQWHGRAIDARADLFALGGCMYHALMGEPAITSAVQALDPGFASRRAEVMHKERAEVPEALSMIVARALADEPRDRFQSAEEMAKALSTALPGATASMPRYQSPSGRPAAKTTPPASAGHMISANAATISAPRAPLATPAPGAIRTPPPGAIHTPPPGLAPTFPPPPQYRGPAWMPMRLRPQNNGTSTAVASFFISITIVGALCALLLGACIHSCSSCFN